MCKESNNTQKTDIEIPYAKSACLQTVRILSNTIATSRIQTFENLHVGKQKARSFSHVTHVLSLSHVTQLFLLGVIQTGNCHALIF